jgi:hypothetical protein
LIAYVGQNEIGYYNLMVIGADGTNRLQLTPQSLQVFAFDWIPSAISTTAATPDAAVAPLATDVSTPTVEATATQMQSTCLLQPINSANLREAPSTTAAIVRTLEAGETVAADGQTTDAAGFVWWHTAEGAWVRTDVVAAPTSCASLPQTAP